MTTSGIIGTIITVAVIMVVSMILFISYGLKESMMIGAGISTVYVATSIMVGSDTSKAMFTGGFMGKRVNLNQYDPEIIAAELYSNISKKEQQHE